MRLIKKNAKKVFLILTAIVFVAVLGSRHNWYGFGDEGGYYRVYDQISRLDFNGFLRKFETKRDWGFYFFCWIISRVFTWPQMIIYVNTTIVIATNFYFIYKKCEDPLLAVSVLFGCGLIGFELSAFRQAMALSLIMIAMLYIERKKNVRALVCIILALTMHRSSLIAVLIFIIPKNRDTIWGKWIYLLFLGIIAFSAEWLLGIGTELTDVTYRLDDQFSTLGFIIQIILFSTPTLFLLLQKKKNINKSMSKSLLSYHWYTNIALMDIIVYIMRIVSLSWERLSYYFHPTIFIQYDNAIKLIKKEEQRWIRNVLIFLMLSLFLYRIFAGIRHGQFVFFWE